MPFKSAEQQRLFAACRDNPSFSEDCPPPEVIAKYFETEARGKGKLQGIKQRIKKKDAEARG